MRRSHRPHDRSLGLRGRCPGRGGRGGRVARGPRAGGRRSSGTRPRSRTPPPRGRERGVRAARDPGPGRGRCRADRCGRVAHGGHGRSGGDGGNYEITASVTGPTGYVEEVRRLTGLDVALVEDGDVSAGAKVADASGLPVAGASGDVEVEGETVRAAASAARARLDAGGAVHRDRGGGFFDSSSRIVAALGLFLVVALGLHRARLPAPLQGQVETMLEAARRIGSGRLFRSRPVVGRDEMAGLAKEFNQMSDGWRSRSSSCAASAPSSTAPCLRLGEAVASGLDQDALLGIVAEAALGGCSAEYAAVEPRRWHLDRAAGGHHWAGVAASRARQARSTTRPRSSRVAGRATPAAPL